VLCCAAAVGVGWLVSAPSAAAGQPRADLPLPQTGQMGAAEGQTACAHGLVARTCPVLDSCAAGARRSSGLLRCSDLSPDGPSWRRGTVLRFHRHSVVSSGGMGGASGHNVSCGIHGADLVFMCIVPLLPSFPSQCPPFAARRASRALRCC
jgi:hypothetical protein